MKSFQDAASASLRIECGPSRGSGFHFIRPNVIVTNNHVVEGIAAPVVAVTEGGHSVPLRLLGASPTDEHDFAIFETQGQIPPGRHVLNPKVLDGIELGREIIFSGFPHGIPDLLVQRAVVAGLRPNGAFYIDGSVNDGNSGGPIVDPEDEAVIGIVTQRRFLGEANLSELARAAQQLRAHYQAVAGTGTVRLMGVDFGAFSGLMAEGMLLLHEAVKANANTGIGIGFSINFVTARCRELGITPEEARSA